MEGGEDWARDICLGVGVGVGESEGKCEGKWRWHRGQVGKKLRTTGRRAFPLLLTVTLTATGGD